MPRTTDRPVAGHRPPASPAASLWERATHVLGHRRFDPDARYGLRLTLFAAAFVLIFVPFGLLLEQVLTAGPLTDFDGRAAEPLVQITRDNRGLEIVFETFSWIGKPIFLFFWVGAASIYLFLVGQRRILVYLLATTIVGGVVDTIIKALVGRGRPTFDGQAAQAFGNSFPSGHALASTVCFGCLTLVLLPHLPPRLRRPTIVAAVALVLSIGFSRLALGMHFVSDVMAGYVIGVAWLLFATAAFSVWRIERHEPAVHLDVEGIEPVSDVERPHRSQDAAVLHDADHPVEAVVGGSVLVAGESTGTPARATRGSR